MAIRNRAVWFVRGLLCLLAALLAGPVLGADTSAPAKTFILHLNGVGGKRAVDQWLIQGLKAGGLEFNYEIYDWTHGDQGMNALQNYEKNHEEAKLIAQLIVKEYRSHPNTRFILTCHSGGAGLATWALEDLPADVHIDSWFMFAPALSPEYDLSKALAHVNGHCYVFSSTLDTIVLDLGTRMFGTIDGIRCAAAGYGGFVQPKAADPHEYEKLVPLPYQKTWLTLFGNAGSHICSMRLKFVTGFVAPLMITGKVPIAQSTPTTQPAAVGAVMP